MITIAICTYNNAESLSVTLESLCGLFCPDWLDYEILVVNNNSSDNTVQVFEEYVPVLGARLKLIDELKQGLSYARNAALKESRGRVVSFIDDDVIVDKGWLLAVAECFKKYDASVVGGKSYLIYPGNRPEWITEHLEIYLSRLDYGDSVIEDVENELYGLNFSVDREKALEVGGFDFRLGRVGTSLASGEEGDLMERIRRCGGKIVYEPAAIVGHVVPESRVRKKWFVKRVYEGAVCLEKKRITDKESERFGIIFERAFRCSGSAVRSKLFESPSCSELFEKQILAVMTLGTLITTFRMFFGRLFRK